MNTRKIKIAGALLLGLLMVNAVYAQPRQGGRGSGACVAGEAYGQRLAWLDLTESQQQELTSLRTEHYKEITPMKNKMAELKAGERTLLSEESVDMKAVNKSIDEQTDLLNSLKKLQTKHQLAVKSILTDEQVMKLQQRRQFAQRNGFHGKGKHRNGRGGKMDQGYRMDRDYRMDRGYRTDRGYRGI